MHVEQRVCPQGIDIGVFVCSDRMLKQTGHSHALSPSSAPGDAIARSIDRDHGMQAEESDFNTLGCALIRINLPEPHLSHNQPIKFAHVLVCCVAS